MAAVGLGLTACTDDWDQHYESATYGEGTLSQAIAKDNSLSNFRDVLVATGYDRILDGSQIFTVFAPSNSQFSTQARDSVIALYKSEKEAGIKDKRNKAIKEFVQNHIALYGHSTSSLTNDSIMMMNGKMLPLTSGAFCGQSFFSANEQANNGLLFKINGVSEYQPNVFEYIARDADLDSLAHFIYQYNEDKFIEESSVPGQIIDGVTHYLDSVTQLVNTPIFSRTFSYNSIDDEDSTYWYLAPTNKVWAEQIAVNETFFQYAKNVDKRDSLMYFNPRMHLLKGTLFSRTVNPNYKDSLMSVNGRPFSVRRLSNIPNRVYFFDDPLGEQGILTGASTYQCSNGIVYKSDDWKIKRSQTFVTNLYNEADVRLDSVDSKTTREPTYVRVSTDNPYYNQVYSHDYVEIVPTAAAQTSSVFKIPDVLSNLEYDVYMNIVPAEAGDTLAPDTERVPTKFRVTVYSCNEAGKEVAMPVTKDLENDPTKVDKVYVGTYKFTTCSWGLEKAQVKVKIDGRVSNTAVKNHTATKTIRLDAIIFEPHNEEL